MYGSVVLSSSIGVSLQLSRFTILLRTTEIACSTVSYNGKSHYLLANVALVGEAILLAMRTN
jgi:hypothetical protein